MNLSGGDFSHLCIAGADFVNADLTNTNFTNSVLQNCNFSNSNISGAIFNNAEFKETSWGERGGIYSFDLSRDGHYLVFSIQGKGIRLWDISLEKVVARLTVTETIYVIRFSHDGKHIVAASRNGEIIICDNKLKEQRLRDLPKYYKIESLCFGFEQDSLIYAAGPTLHTINILSGERKTINVNTNANIRSLSCEYQSKTLSIGCKDGNLIVLRGNSYSLVMKSRIHLHSIRALDTDISGRWVASGGKGGKLTLTELSTGKINFVKLPGAIFSLSINSHFGHISVSIHGRELVILNIPDLKIIHRYQGHKENVRELHYGRDGKNLFTASYDGSIKTWSVPLYEIMNSVESTADGKKRMLCQRAQFVGAKGLTEEYNFFFKDRGAIL